MMKSRSSVPQGCSYAITHERYQYYPAPNYRSYAMSIRSNRNVYLSAGVEELAKQIEEDISDLEEKVRRVLRP